MDTAAREIAVAQECRSNAGPAGSLRGKEADDLLNKICGALLRSCTDAETGARKCIDTDDLDGADVHIAHIWRACRHASIAKGRVSANACYQVLDDAQAKQAQEQGSIVIPLQAEISGSREQIQAMNGMDLTELERSVPEASGCVICDAACTHVLQHARN